MRVLCLIMRLTPPVDEFFAYYTDNAGEHWPGLRVVHTYKHGQVSGFRLADRSGNKETRDGFFSVHIMRDSLGFLCVYVCALVAC